MAWKVCIQTVFKHINDLVICGNPMKINCKEVLVLLHYPDHFTVVKMIRNEFCRKLLNKIKCTVKALYICGSNLPCTAYTHTILIRSISAGRNLLAWGGFKFQPCRQSRSASGRAVDLRATLYWCDWYSHSHRTENALPVGNVQTG